MYILKLILSLILHRLLCLPLSWELCQNGLLWLLSSIICVEKLALLLYHKSFGCLWCVQRYDSIAEIVWFAVLSHSSEHDRFFQTCIIWTSRKFLPNISSNYERPWVLGMAQVGFAWVFCTGIKEEAWYRNRPLPVDTYMNIWPYTSCCSQANASQPASCPVWRTISEFPQRMVWFCTICTDSHCANYIKILHRYVFGWEIFIFFFFFLMFFSLVFTT